MLIQILNLVTGLAMIRLMSLQEYAWYTIANTALGTLTILSDGGISTGVVAEGGKVWNSKALLGGVVQTGLDLRRKFGIISLAISLPILIFLLYRQNASIFIAVIISLSLIPSFFSSLSDNILEIPLKLNQSISKIQKNQLIVAIFRLGLSSISLFIFPFTFIALLCNGIPRFIANIKLKKLSENFADKNAVVNEDVRKNISNLVKRILPGSVYFCVSSQLTLWLISIFGTSDAIAQIGGLSRLSMMLSILTVVFNTLALPYFAKLKPLKLDLIKSFFAIQGILFGLFSVLILIIYLFSKEILWLLGGNYSNLGKELVCTIIANVIGVLSGFVFGLYTSRGWAIKPFISIPLNILITVLLIFIFKPNTVLTVIYFTMVNNIIQYFINSFFCIKKIISLNNLESSE
jgi:hypothetical protein